MDLRIECCALKKPLFLPFGMESSRRLELAHTPTV